MDDDFDPAGAIWFDRDLFMGSAWVGLGCLRFPFRMGKEVGPCLSTVEDAGGEPPLPLDDVEPV